MSVLTCEVCGRENCICTYRGLKARVVESGSEIARLKLALKAALAFAAESQPPHVFVKFEAILKPAIRAGEK